MVTVQRFPEGVLPLLQLQTSGIPPQVLQQAVALGIDGLPFYSAAADRVTVGSAITLVGLSSAIALTVPAGEFWLMHHASCQWTAPAAPAAGLRLAWHLTRNGSTVYLPSYSDAAVTLSAIGAQTNWVWLPNRLIMLRPGDYFSIEQSLSPDNVSGRVACLYTRLVA